MVKPMFANVRLVFVLVFRDLVKVVLIVNGKTSCWFKTPPFVDVFVLEILVFVPEILEILSCRIAG